MGFVWGRKEGLSLARCGSNNDCTEILAPEREAKRGTMHIFRDSGRLPKIIWLCHMWKQREREILEDAIVFVTDNHSCWAVSFI